MATHSVTLQAVAIAILIFFCATDYSTAAHADSRPHGRGANVAAQTTALKHCDYLQSHFTISLPADWTTRNDVVAPVVAAPKGVLKTRPELPNIKVKVSPLEPGIDLKRLADSELTQWADRWKVVSDKTRKFGPRQGRFIVVDTEIDGVKVRMLRMYTIGNGRYFVVVCTANIKEYPRYQKLFDSVALTLKIVS